MWRRAVGITDGLHLGGARRAASASERAQDTAVASEHLRSAAADREALKAMDKILIQSIPAKSFRLSGQSSTAIHGKEDAQGQKTLPERNHRYAEAIRPIVGVDVPLRGNHNGCVTVSWRWSCPH